MAKLDPADRTAAMDAWFSEAIVTVRTRLKRPVLVGLSGAQGSGKSTAARRIVQRLESAGLKAFACSLDDFYLTRKERLSLARDVHPLLAVRGVPGTHDVELMDHVISALLTASGDDEIAVPAFDKALDERRARRDWPRVRGAVDVVLIEGWCVGARPQPSGALVDPINDLERDADSDGRWRRFVNAQLSRAYADCFARLDLRLMLRAPSFACVHGWRSEQEAGLDRSASSARRAMNSEEIARFIAHYERLTHWLLQDEPADMIVDLDQHRMPTNLRHDGKL